VRLALKLVTLVAENVGATVGVFPLASMVAIGARSLCATFQPFRHTVSKRSTWTATIDRPALFSVMKLHQFDGTPFAFWCGHV
jgi:hypothetical protein